MNITEVRVKMVSDGTERLRAFCSVTLDDAFVIRDLKVIDGSDGPFVAMPSRKLSDRCPKCGNKNHLRARFCNECGGKLNENRAPRDAQGRVKLHADIAHPINATCREQVQKAVIEAFTEELDRRQQPGYQPPPYDEVEEEGFDQGTDEPATCEDVRESSGYDELIAELKETAQRRRQNGGERKRSPDRPRRGHRRGGRPAGSEHGSRSKPAEPRDSEPAAPEAAPPPAPVEPPPAAEDEDSFGAGLL